MDPLKYFLKICTFGIWQHALFLSFGLTYFNLVIWHRFSIKHPSIGLTMIQSLKRGLNKELFGYRWVDNLGCQFWEGWHFLIQAMYLCVGRGGEIPRSMEKDLWHQQEWIWLGVQAPKRGAWRKGMSMTLPSWWNLFLRWLIVNRI
jgi:hypothetical protein